MQKKTKPLVTVLMTAYNAQPFIGLALESLLNQTYKNLEIIIVDDGSTDGTVQEIRRFKFDPRVRVFQFKKNQGPSQASNFGLTKAKGEFLARMDADDIAFPERIEKQVDFLLAHPEVVMLGSQCFLINEESEVVGEKNFPLEHQQIYSQLFFHTPIQHPSCMINLRLLPRALVLYQNHSVLAHDLELIFILSQYGKLANLKETLLYYRQYADSLSLKSPKKTFKAALAVRLKALRVYGYQPTLTGWGLHFLQAFLITLLPERLIYPLYFRLRVKKIKNSNLPGLQPGWRNCFNGAFLREKK